MKRAVVDIGTNSTRLYIADVGKEIKRIEKQTVITRLGKAVDRDRKLSAEAMKRNIEVLLDFKKIARSYSINEIQGIATSAVRDASNREEFLNMVRDKTGIDIYLISGEEEARLGFLGASSVLNGECGIVIDIGGGSTEFIYGEKGRIITSKSVNIGAVRMTERFLNGDSITLDAMDKARAYIRNEISSIVSKISSFGLFPLAGIGGTATTLAAIDQGLLLYDIDKVHHYKLYKENLDSIFQRLSCLSLEERKKIAGLQPERADIIVAGTLILKIIMEEFHSNYITISECDNLDGYLVEKYL